MPANEPFTGFYSERTRALLPCLSGQETKVFLAVALSTGPDGTGFPGIRALADYTTYPPNAVSDLLLSLEEKNIVVCIRKNAIDPYTKRMLPDVYGVNPNYVLVSDPTIWNENRLRNACMPESTFPVNSAQADRITEAESDKENQRSRITAPEGAALLSNANTPGVATRSWEAIGQNGGANNPVGSRFQPNSTAQPKIPPGSGAPPLRPLTMQETAAISGVKRHVHDMSHETAADLVIRYGVEQFTAAVMSYTERAKKIAIKKPTGWIIQNLKIGEKRR